MVNRSAIEELCLRSKDPKTLSEISTQDFLNILQPDIDIIACDCYISKDILKLALLLLKKNIVNLDSLAQSNELGILLRMHLFGFYNNVRLLAAEIVHFISKQRVHETLTLCHGLSELGALSYNGTDPASLFALETLYNITNITVESSFIDILNPLTRIITRDCHAIPHANLAVRITCNIMHAVQSAIIKPTIVILHCQLFMMQNNPWSLRLRLLECLLACVYSHCNLIHTMISPFIFGIFMREALQRNPRHCEILLPLIDELFATNFLLSNYVHGSQGVSQFVDMLRCCICDCPYLPPTLIGVYSRCLRHSELTYEEDNKVLLRIISQATCHVMWTEVYKLFQVYLLKPEAFRLVIHTLHEVRIFDWQVFGTDNTSFKHREAFAEMGNQYIEASKQLKAPTSLEREANHVNWVLQPYFDPLENLDFISIAVAISTSIPNESLRIMNLPVLVKFVDGVEYYHKLNTTLYQVLYQYLGYDYSSHDKIPQNLQFVVDKYVIFPVEGSELFWALRSRLPFRTLPVIKYGNRVIPIEWSLSDVVPANETVSVELLRDVDDITLRQDVFMFVHPIPGHWFNWWQGPAVLTKFATDLLSRRSNHWDDVLSNHTTRLSAEMWERLRFYVESNSKHSASIEFIHRHSRWFDADIRLYAFLMRNMPSWYTFEVYTKRFPHTDISNHQKTHILLNLSSQQLNCDVMNVLCMFGRSVVPLSFQIDGKALSRSEFYALVAKECRESLTQAPEEGYWMPTENTTYNDMELLGILFAHILLREIAVDIRFESRFFALLRGDDHAMKDLCAPLEWAQNMRKAFRTGFDSVYVPRGYRDFFEIGLVELLQLFTDNELIELFAGLPTDAALKYLCVGGGIKSGIGYTDESYQIKWFKKVLRRLNIMDFKRVLIKILGTENILSIKVRRYIIKINIKIVNDPDNEPITILENASTISLPLYSNYNVMKNHILLKIKDD
jgi:hypothetical protein